jgi:hypothetical protein
MKEFFSIDLEKLSIINFVWLVFLGVFLSVTIHLTKNYLLLFLVKSPLKRKKLSIKIPVYEILLWVLFAMHAVYILILPFPFLGIVILATIVYLIRKELNDLLQGVLFRIKGMVELDEKIEIGNKEGRIESFNLFDVYFENKEGEIEVMHYRDLVSKVIIKKDFSSEFFSYKFTIKTNNSITKRDLEKQILLLPWSFSGHKPRITPKEDKENTYDILIYTIDKRYFSFIEDEIRKINA